MPIFRNLIRIHFVEKLATLIQDILCMKVEQDLKIQLGLSARWESKLAILIHIDLIMETSCCISIDFDPFCLLQVSL